ncbi:MAG: hypothetical protein GF317_12915 [Candidatus Lokiarchaeota archaeon]|nr:hypothetical protein [Candidatus Lokiarchaeota archaeon]MBD3200542.1 hypothetical protein [Candidatus Lokiarchaeota archaeon]
MIKHLLIAPIKYLFDKKNIDGVLSIADKQISLSFNDLNNLKLDDWIKSVAKINSVDISLSFSCIVSNNIQAEVKNYKDKIIRIIIPYINEVLSFWSLKARLDKYPNADPIVEHLTLKFLKDIDLGAQIAKVSSLIFGNNDELPRKLRRGTGLRAHSFPSLKYQINRISSKDFKKIYDLKLSDFGVEIIKEKLRETISQTFKTFIREKSYTRNNLGSETTQLLSSIIYATSLHDNLHKQSGTQFYGLRGKITEILQISTKGLLVIAKEGPSANLKIESLYNTISLWLQQEYGDRAQGIHHQETFEDTERFHAYQEALRNIYRFARNKGFDFDSVTVRDMTLMEALKKPKGKAPKELVMNYYDLNTWKDKISKAYINVLQISKFFGIDPLTFRINPNNQPFDPHHFKAFPFRKMSSHGRDLIVTSRHFHPIYDKMQNKMGWRVGEMFIDSLMKSLEDLIYLKDDSGNYREIKPDDIKHVLKKNFGGEWEYVYEGWVSEFSKGVNIEGIGDFDKALDDINQQRLKYLPGNPNNFEAKDFLKIEYPDIYKNHFRDHLMKASIILSDYVTTQDEIDEYNRLFPQYKIKLKREFNI